MWSALLIVASSANPAPQQLELSLGPKTQTIRQGKKATFRIELRNVGKSPCLVVDVRDGSIEHWVTPLVGWSVLKDNDEEHPLLVKPIVGARCGNVNSIQLKDMLAVNPRESVAIGSNGWLQRGGPETYEPGTYRVAFHYRNEPRKLHKMEFDVDTEARKLLWRSYPCTLRSNEVIVIVEPRLDPP